MTPANTVDFLSATQFIIHGKKIPNNFPVYSELVG
jgi:hypothetical protein